LFDHSAWLYGGAAAGMAVERMAARRNHEEMGKPAASTAELR
jgi:hypothetical protein